MKVKELFEDSFDKIVLKLQTPVGTLFPYHTRVFGKQTTDGVIDYLNTTPHFCNFTAIGYNDVDDILDEDSKDTWLSVHQKEAIISTKDLYDITTQSIAYEILLSNSFLKKADKQAIIVFKISNEKYILISETGKIIFSNVNKELTADMFWDEK